MRASVEAFQKSFVENTKWTPVDATLGRAYLDANMYGEAVSELEKLQANCRGQVPVSRSRLEVYYYLGLAYEKSGWTKKAIGQYEEFLDILKNADNGIVEVDDAKTRLAGLRKKVQTTSNP